MVGVEEADHLARQDHRRDDVRHGTAGIHDDGAIHPRVAGIQHRRGPVLGEHLGLQHEVIQRYRPVDPLGEPRPVDRRTGEMRHPRPPGLGVNAGQHGAPETAPVDQLLTSLIDQLRDVAVAPSLRSAALASPSRRAYRPKSCSATSEPSVRSSSRIARTSWVASSPLVATVVR